LALAHTDTLEADGEAVEVTLGDVPPPHDPPGAEVLEAQVHKGGDDAGGKDPFRDCPVNGRSYGGRPLVKGEQVDGDKGVDAVDGDGEQEEEVEVAVGEWREAAGGLEVFQVLREIVRGCGAGSGFSVFDWNRSGLTM
jgi:hypothetical protein